MNTYPGRFKDDPTWPRWKAMNEFWHWRQRYDAWKCRRSNPPKDHEFWLPPIYVPASQYGDQRAQPVVQYPLTNPFTQNVGITKYRFEMWGRPKTAADPSQPSPSMIPSLSLLGDHHHRVHLHHVNGDAYRSGISEVFTGSGHDRQPVVLPDPYYYRVQPGDQWRFDVDLRNRHVDPADIDPAKPVQVVQGPDVDWVVAVKWTITVDECLQDRPTRNVVPFWMVMGSSAGGGFSSTFGVVANRPTTATATEMPIDILRQDRKVHSGVTGVEFTQSFTVPFAGTLVYLFAHIHTGAASAVLEDAAGNQIAKWTPILSPVKHPTHIDDFQYVGPTTPKTVAANEQLTVRIRYSNDPTTRDGERAASRTLDGSRYDFNNDFEMNDAMGIVIAAINPS